MNKTRRSGLMHPVPVIFGLAEDGTLLYEVLLLTESYP
jgi:hypothetical protein